ncbi:MAG TPA: DUF4249 domain-containing protein [Chitinophagaceae bacterium]|nr:DUF4249 domain-containing protein [Chitinophagaceae bacterium]
MRTYKKYFVVVVISVLAGCVKSYNPPVLKAGNNYLVVDGFINTGAGQVTTIILSRTRNLTDTVTSNPETGASINIKGSDGSSYFLNTTGNGIYTSAALTLNTANTYQLQITTSNGKQYSSAFVPCKQTPPIDSLRWEQRGDAIIYLTTHDPANNTLYYKWQYEETWQYYAQLQATYGVANGLIYVSDSSNQTDSCWLSGLSTNVLIGNSTALAQDVISDAKIATIPKDDERIGVRYSILVKQYAISAEAYKYWQIIQKNSQERGGLFDLQPAQLSANIFCDTDPTEPVVGFLSAASEQISRIFIRNKELTDWTFNPIPGYDCPSAIIPGNPVDYRIYDYPDPTYWPWYFVTGGGIVITKKDCLDCRSHGGTNKRPVFW